MVSFALSPRWGAVARLQKMSSRLNPGNRYADAVDHAITLALSASRDPNDEYFLWNVLRDSKRVLARRRSTPTFTDVESDNAVRAERYLQDRRSYEPSLHVNAKAIEAEIRRSVGKEPHASECLGGMLAGETRGETARRLGIKTHRVDWLRRRIRMAAANPLRREVRHAR